MKKIGIPKINSIHFGGTMICAALIIGAVIPVLLRFFTGKLYKLPVIAGSLILAVFIAVFIVEMHQDNGSTPYFEKGLKDKILFDPEKQYAVVRSSICTGEKLAGFRNKADGHFTEVMLIRSQGDLDRFMKIYGIDKVKTEY